MVTVGDRWARGEIGAADEDLATDISMRMIALQREAFRVARKRSSATVLLGPCVEKERHVVGLEMAASALLHAASTCACSAPTCRRRRSSRPSRDRAGRARAHGGDNRRPPLRPAASCILCAGVTRPRVS